MFAVAVVLVVIVVSVGWVILVGAILVVRFH